MRRICIYCGSSSGRIASHCDAAVSLGKTLAGRGIGLVYGGASVGIMGAVADSILAEGGEVFGVIPESLLEFEVAHTGLTELITVDSMHARKAKMEELSDAFIALPGGLGTLEELFEMLTWSQLRLHRKPIGVLNTTGFFDKLLGFLDDTVEAGFVRPEHRNNLLVSDDPAALLAQLEAWEPPTIDKWWKEE